MPGRRWAITPHALALAYALLLQLRLGDSVLLMALAASTSYIAA